MVRVSVKVDGLQALGKRLAQLERRVSTRIGRNATAAGARVIRNVAKTKVPVRTGQLRDNIVIKKLKSPKGKFDYAIGLVGKESKYANNASNRRKGRAGQSYWRNKAYYGYMVEFGTRKMAARPFLRPAYEEAKKKAADTVEQRIREGIERNGG